MRKKTTIELKKTKDKRQKIKVFQKVLFANCPLPTANYLRQLPFAHCLLFLPTAIA
jgi:hypothetical protein